MKRIVLGTNADGSSEIAQDSEPLAMFYFSAEQVGKAASGAAPQKVDTFVEHPTPSSAMLAELFGSDTSVPSVNLDTSATMTAWDPNCPPGGFRYRISYQGPHAESPMHRTETFDIDIVLAGEVTVTTKDGAEALLTAGDSIVIPGVDHAWRAGPEGVQMAYLMFGTE